MDIYSFTAEYKDININCWTGLSFDIECDDYIEAWHKAIDKAALMPVMDTYGLVKLRMEVL